MRKLLFIIFICLPAFANSQGLSQGAPWKKDNPIIWSAPFLVPGCYASGSTAGSSSAISITRNTTATIALTSDPSILTTCASGEFRVGYKGLLIEPARTNYAKQSNTISLDASYNPPWANYLTTIATVANAPVGGNWGVVTSTNAGGLYYSPITGTGNNTNYSVSVSMMKSSGTGSAGFRAQTNVNTSALSCYRDDGGSCSVSATGSTDSFVSISDLGATVVRLTLNITLPSPGALSQVGLIPGEWGVSTGVTRFSGVQVEVGKYPTSLIVTTTDAVPRAADIVSTTIPSTPLKFCLALTATPEGGRLWNQGEVQVVFSTLGGTDYSNLYSDGTVERFQISTAGAGVTRYGAFTGGASSRLVACSPGTNQLTLTLNGVDAPFLGYTGAGPGTAVNSGTTLYLGSQSSNLYFGGYLKGIKFCKTGSASKCL